jgi:hypothetical protein
MKSKTYLIISLIGTLLFLMCFAGITIYIDPLFHYHARVDGIQYPLYDERYMNDGITRNFEYDSVITGTSMTENFKTSIWDGMFGTNSIKIPFSGASYYELNNVLERCFDRNDYIRLVMRGLDMTGLLADKDSMSYEEYPDYLYDDNIFNDVYYVLNKEIFFTFTEYVFTFNRLGGNSTEFDVYKNWNYNYEYSAQKLIEKYSRWDISDSENPLTQEDINMMTENLEQNVIAIVSENPQTQFYFFIPPYSVLYWDEEIRSGNFDRILEAHKLEIELLLPYENVHLFSFIDNTDITYNLNYYIDSLHYNQTISDFMMECMYNNVGLLTENNYQQYIENLRNTYGNFDYDGLFAEYGK